MMATINADRFSKITGSFSDRHVAYTSVHIEGHVKCLYTLTCNLVAIEVLSTAL